MTREQPGINQQGLHMQGQHLTVLHPPRSPACTHLEHAGQQGGEQGGHAARQPLQLRPLQSALLLAEKVGGGCLGRLLALQMGRRPAMVISHDTGSMAGGHHATEVQTPEWHLPCPALPPRQPPQ